MWAVNIVAGVLLLVLLAVRKNYRAYPAFSLYVLLHLVLGILAFLVYSRLAFFSSASWRISWTLQALVSSARGVGVIEVCKHPPVDLEPSQTANRGNSENSPACWRLPNACAAIQSAFALAQ